MANFLDTLARAVQDALEGYQRYQLQIRPALEEQTFLREQRRGAIEDRRRQLAGSSLALARQIYGSDEAIAEALGEEAYTNLVRSASGGMVAPTFRDVPIMERIRERQQVGVRPVVRRGPFEDVEPPVPVTGTGPGLVRAGLPTRRTMEIPAPVAAPPQTVEEPVFEDVEVERPTGRTRRELVLPGRVQEPTVEIPSLGLRLPLSQAREAFGPEGLRWLAGITNPIEVARLQLDMGKASFDQTMRTAQLEWQQFQHANPSAFQQADLRLRLLQQQALGAYRDAQLALQRGQLQELRRWHDMQARLQAEVNALRRQAVNTRGGVGGLTPAQLLTHYRNTREQIGNLQAQLAFTPPETRQALQAEIDALQDELQMIEPQVRAILEGRQPVTDTGRGVHRGQRVVYQTRHSGVLNAKQVEAIIANMVRQRMTDQQIRRALQENGIPPTDFGY